MAPRGEPSGWGTPQITIAIISLLMAAGGSYVGFRQRNGDELRALDSRITAIKTEADIRSAWRDQQIADIRLRLEHLEDRRRRWEERQR